MLSLRKILSTIASSYRPISIEESEKQIYDFWTPRKKVSVLRSTTASALKDVLLTYKEISALIVPEDLKDELATDFSEKSILYYSYKEDGEIEWETIERLQKENLHVISLICPLIKEVNYEKRVQRLRKLISSEGSALLVECFLSFLPAPKSFGKSVDYSLIPFYRFFPVLNGTLLLGSKGTNFSTERVHYNLTFPEIFRLINHKSKPNANDYRLKLSSISYLSHLSQIDNHKKEINSFKRTKALFFDFIFHKYEIDPKHVSSNYPMILINEKGISKEKLVQLKKYTSALKNHQSFLIINHLDLSWSQMLSSLKSSLLFEIEVCDGEKFSSTKVAAKAAPLTQDFYYIKEKSEFEGLKALYILLNLNGSPIGKVAVLKKNIMGIPVYRINQGPVISRKYSMLASTIITSSFLKERLSLGGFLINKPLISNESYDTFKSLFPLHFSFNRPYSSGLIDLQGAEDKIFNQFTGVFRNRLKKAASNPSLIVEISNSKEAFGWVLSKYISYMKEKQFQGIAPELIRRIHHKVPEKVLIGTVKKDGETISTLLLYLHGNSATYLIGYNTKVGRRLNVNNLLFWEVIKELRIRKFEYFDLGGIDHENTPSISKFKERMNPEIYTLPKEQLILWS